MTKTKIYWLIFGVTLWCCTLGNHSEAKAQCQIDRPDLLPSISFLACPNNSYEIRIEFVNEVMCDLAFTGADWISVTPTPGYGFERVMVWAQNNPNSSSRSATISVRTVAQGTLLGTFTVTQAGNSLAAGSVSATITTIPHNTSPGALSNATSASGGTLPLSYQWESSADNSTWSAIAGATAVSYTPGNLTQSTYFRRRVRDNCNTLRYSNVLAISVIEPGITYANENYLVTHRPRDPINSLGEASSGKILGTEITYYDGLGRPMQQIEAYSSPSEKDIVTPIEHDGLGRQVKDYLPYRAPDGTAGHYRSDGVTAQRSFYNSSPGDVVQIQHVGGVTPSFAQRVYEPSPLNRTKEQGFPGATWQPATNRTATAGRTVVTEHTSNNTIAFGTLSSTRRVANYGVSLSADRTPTLTLAGAYAANTLRVTVTRDENWLVADGRAGTVEEYTDKQGRMVLRRAFNWKDNSLEMLSTYYVYDDFNNLTFVLPPGTEPDRATLPTGAALTTWLTEYCYQYRYDKRNRLVEKQLPGKGREFIVYNKLNQIVAQQDINQRSANEWLITKYDGLGRMILTGIWNNNNQAVNRAVLEGVVDGYTGTNLWENRSTSGVGYTSTAWPTQYITTYLTLHYYDSYTVPGFPTGYAHSGSTKMTRGLPTVTRTKVLGQGTGATNMLWEVSYYDKYGRVTKQFKQHYREGGTANTNNYDEITNEYNFTGQPEKIVREHYVSGNPSVKVTTEYRYDHWGRLLDTWKQIDSNDPVLTSGNEYNEIGQLAGKRLHRVTDTEGTVPATIIRGTGYSTPFVFTSGQHHNDVASQSVTLKPGFHAQSGSRFTASIGDGYLQRITYKYNERGWLLETNAPLFKQVLKYQNGTIPQYNGNVANQEFTRHNANTSPTLTSETYTYTYDRLNRLLSGTMANGKGKEELTYNKMGNISTLKRTGVDNVLVDDLTFTYAGNRLSEVVDAKSSADANYQLPGTTAYLYDGNGNLTDRNNAGTGFGANNIGNISYNHLNLPRSLTVASGNITYIYDASGRKLRSINAIPGQTRDYVDGIEYYNGTLELIHAEEGRIVKSGNNYRFDYVLRDHLGNSRVGFSQTNANLPNFVADYYPFGLQYQADKRQPSPNNHYLYNGKELQGRIKQYDYGARLYDPVIGRWGTMDPLAELYQHWSPYNYGNNNPIYFIDPDGRSSEGLSTRYVDPSGRTIVNTQDGRHDVVEVPWDRMDEFKEDLEWANKPGQNGRIHKKGWNDIWRHEFGVQIDEHFLYEIGYFGLSSEKVQESLIELLYGSRSYQSFVWEEVKAQWNDPVLVTTGLLASVHGSLGAFRTYTKSSLARGQKMHKAYHAGKIGKEFRLPSGKRIDYLDMENGIIYELKPNNPRAISQGKAQLKMYKEELQSEAFLKKYPQLRDIDWKMVLDKY